MKQPGSLGIPRWIWIAAFLLIVAQCIGAAVLYRKCKADGGRADACMGVVAFLLNGGLNGR